MKKLYIFSISIIILLSGLIYVLPFIRRAESLPDGMVVTYQDIEKVNSNKEFSPIIKLSADKNLTASQNGEPINTTLKIKLFNLFTIKKVNVKLVIDTNVYVGGELVGFNLFSDGVICVGSNTIITENGAVEPMKETNIKEGDAITHIQDMEINSIDDIDRIINLPSLKDQPLKLTIRRNNETLYEHITPAYDIISHKYKLGLWVKNSASGVGTLTYVKQNDFRFGAVGHPILDEEADSNFTLNQGNIYKCKLVGIKKGEKFDPGEIRSTINLSDDAVGIADTNCKYGVFGTILNKSILDASNIMALSGRLGVKTGDAKIYCSVDNDGVKAYDIKIIRANKQTDADDRSMIIKVTDPELLEKTGGIIQGMSGSPIVQDGKVVGAVTHVFVNDPTKGYGVYIDWMIDN